MMRDTSTQALVIRRLCLFLVMVFTILGLGCGPAIAWDYGSRDEAKAMSERAVQFFRQHGRDAAFQAFQNGTNGFRDRDLYVFVYDNAGTCVSHGANPSMIGRNLIDLTDGNGKPLIREIVAVKTADWVIFKWRNPQNHEIQTKASYIVRHGDLVFGVGAYEKPNSAAMGMQTK